MRGKKGQDLSLTTLILIVLGVVVLAMLIFGFTTGWSNLWDRINIFGGNNVDSIQNACILACTSQNNYDFCKLERTIKFGEKIPKMVGEEKEYFNTVIVTCDKLAKGKSGSIKLDFSKTSGVDVTNEVLEKISVEPCSGLC